MRYTQGDPESAQSHRKEHNRVTRLLSPRPSRRMRERVKQGSHGERVDDSAPTWMHHVMYERTVRIKREFGYDFVQCPFAAKREHIEPSWVGYLFATPDGAIDGVCGFKEQGGE